MNAFNQVGIVPEEVYSGINYDSDRHNHAEMVKYIKAIATTAVDMKKRSPEYYKLIDNLFDTYLGKLPEKFTYQGKEYTPKTFAASLGLEYGRLYRADKLHASSVLPEIRGRGSR